MKRVIKSATNTCGMAAKITSSDEDRVDYSYDDYEWLATKDVQDSDGFLTEYTMYRRRSDGMYVMVFGDRDLYSPEDSYFDYETDDEQDAWDWFDSYTGFDDDEDMDIYSATTIEANREDRYFGEIASKKYGQLICDNLTGQKISKRKSTANGPGGLIYEAEQLGIGMWDLLEALEGMCADGRAVEIDDSTYLVRGGEPHEVRSMFGATYTDMDGDEQDYSDWGVELVEDVDDHYAIVRDGSGRYTRWSKSANRPLSRINKNNEYVPVWYNSIDECYK